LPELQHINVKLLLKEPQAVDLEALIPVFHSWIQGQVFEDRLLDVADYSHVHHGPGVILIGHEGDYSVDNTDGRLGLRYNRKAVLNNNNLGRLQQATRAVLRACQRLEAESNLKLSFNGQDLEIFINDRLLAPNREDTREACRPEFDTFAKQLFHGGEYSLSFSTDPRRLFTVFVKASRAYPVAELLGNLSS
jgi:hypothetical protein